jgi:flagellar FliL protein
MASTKLPALLTEPVLKPAGMPVMQFVLSLLILTLVAAAAGAFFGMQFVSIVKDAQVEKKDAPPLADPAFAGTMNVKELPSIVTNLAGPDHVMIRLQAAILFDAKVIANPDVLASQISDDVLAFLTTVSSSQIEGASGLQHLREDLGDRAKIRSEGRVRELIIETLVVQ